MDFSRNRSRVLKRSKSFLVTFGQVLVQRVTRSQLALSRRQMLLALTLLLALILFVISTFLAQRLTDNSDLGPRTSVLSGLAETSALEARQPSTTPSDKAIDGASSSRASDIMPTEEPEIATALERALTPQAQSSRNDDGVRYFAETGHTLALFRDFWERSNGEVVFGPPLTEAFEDRPSNRGQTRTIQYFATQRIEHHPEMQGTEFEFLLGRLGYEDAKRRELLTTSPFDPLPVTTESTDECLYFDRTRHRLCGMFRDFWEANGLDLGDSGISRRESIALFGYPISEEFVSASSGVVVQYFERARFEIHPTDEERVTIAWLGADALAQRLSDVE